jgi:REP element-mobilizing transposase RayT
MGIARRFEPSHEWLGYSRASLGDEIIGMSTGKTAFRSHAHRSAAMGHSYTSSLFHCAFSTKGRRPLITPELRPRLWPYLGGIARENDVGALAIGGVGDHVHLLLSLPSTLAIADAMQRIKGASSKWVHDTFPGHRNFNWQEGYGAFSIGISQIAATRRYIERQEEHHRKTTFQEEFLAFLKRHGIEYDERYIWD